MDLDVCSRAHQSIPKITLYDYIKNSTKAKRDGAFKAAKGYEAGKNEEVKMAKAMVRNWDRNDL